MSHVLGPVFLDLRREIRKQNRAKEPSAGLGVGLVRLSQGWTWSLQTKTQRAGGVWFRWVLFLHGMRVVLLCLLSSCHRSNFLVGLGYQHRCSSPIHRQPGAPAPGVPGKTGYLEGATED